MDLLYLGSYGFRQKDGKTYALPGSSDSFFQKFLKVFDKIIVVGSPLPNSLEDTNLVEMTDTRIRVIILPSNSKPQQFLNDFKVKPILKKLIDGASAILIKPTTRRGIMATKIATSKNKPFMIDVTGDIHLSLITTNDWKRKLYAPIIFNQIRRAIKDCRFGLYVTQEYLQSQYPIAGEMCGCSDVELNPVEAEVLDERLKKIEEMKSDGIINISMVGFYHNTRKGIDTAIKALALLPDNYHLNVLGNGTEENRRKWLEFGEALGIFGRIHFPKPLPSTKAVIDWLKTQDINILPSRSEGLVRCVMEAMSVGMPCIGSDSCSMPELHLPECMHPVEDYKKLSELILRYGIDKELMKAHAKRNFEKAKEYAPDILDKRRTAFLERFKSYCESFQR